MAVAEHLTDAGGEEMKLTCLFCQEVWHKKRHKCTSECKPLAVGVDHVDVCDQCENALVAVWETQFRVKFLPKLRVEGG